MPLAVNQQDCISKSTLGISFYNRCQTDTMSAEMAKTKAADGSISASRDGGPILYKGESKGVKSDTGGTGKEKDTYSVFASIGAKVDAGKSEAGIGIAQFLQLVLLHNVLGLIQGLRNL